MAKFAREYGFTNVTIEDFPTGQTWQPLVGELWVTSPRPEKIYDLHDIPEAVASTNANADITGDLIGVGQGTAQDFEGKDVKGKFVLTLAPGGLGAVYNRAVAAGAIGALGISAIGGPRGRLPGSDRLDNGARNRIPPGALAEEGAATGDPAEPRAEGHDPVINKSEQVPNSRDVHAEIAGDGSMPRRSRSAGTVRGLHQAGGQRRQPGVR
jgi:hypothetical protein